MLKKNERICKTCKGIINLDDTEYYKDKYMKRSKYFCSYNCLINYLKKHGLYRYKDEEYIKENYIKIKGEKMETKEKKLMIKTMASELEARAYQKCKFSVYYPDTDEEVDYIGIVCDMGTSGIAGNGYYDKSEPLHLDYLAVKDNEEFIIFDEISRLRNELVRESLVGFKTIGDIIINQDWQPRIKCGCIM